MLRIQLTLSIQAPPFGEQTMSAWLFAPDDVAAEGPVDLLVCFSGAGFGKRYWHSEFAGHAGYSFAERFTSPSRLVLALEHLGTGDSGRPQPVAELTRQVAADADAAAVAQVVEGLTSGRWLPPVPGPITPVGVAHSMGGMVLITQQARHATFDRLAVLGWTNIGLQADYDVEALAAQVATMGYVPSDRASMRPLFHAPDVPVEVMDADDAAATVTPAPLGADALRPGIVRAEAAEVACPVFLAYGEYDLSPSPHEEPAAYAASRDITLVLLPGSAHNHNFSSARFRLWDRLDAWLGTRTFVA